jgi:tetratricopeptide (TPR) repeat protein
VFDNATDAELLRRYLPAAGKAQVIITSTHHDITSLGEPVNVDVFTEPEGLAFLSRRTGLDDAAGARAVGEEVGWLPLALAQAAAVIASQRLDYATYLGRLQLRVEGLLRPIEASGYPYGTAAVILLSLGDVATGDDTGACADVMALLAVLSAGGVRRALVHAAVKSRIPEENQPASWLPDEVADRALARLAGASLLTFTVDGTAVTAHRLVTRVIRDQLAATGRLADVCQVAARLLDAQATALSPSWHEDPAAARDLIEQITALHQSSAQCPDADRRAPVMVPPRVWAVWLLNQLGDNPDRAIQIGEPLLADSLRILGLGHALTLSARNDLAHAYYYAGRTKDSIRLYRRNLAERERLLGPDDPDHPDILASRGNLATAYLQAGQTGAAIILHERNLADRERTLGPDHRDLLSTRFNLARAYAQAERTDDAIAMFERTLAECERTLPTDHVNTLLACDNLASTYRRAGRTPEAITLHERALAARSRILGADHPHTLASRNHLAAAYRAAGRAADAAALGVPGA